MQAFYMIILRGIWRKLNPDLLQLYSKPEHYQYKFQGQSLGKYWWCLPCRKPQDPSKFVQHTFLGGQSPDLEWIWNFNNMQNAPLKTRLFNPSKAFLHWSLITHTPGSPFCPKQFWALLRPSTAKIKSTNMVILPLPGSHWLHSEVHSLYIQASGN